jgi:hypothetical protein
MFTQENYNLLLFVMIINFLLLHSPSILYAVSAVKLLSPLSQTCLSGRVGVSLLRARDSLSTVLSLASVTISAVG